LYRDDGAFRAACRIVRGNGFLRGGRLECDGHQPAQWRRNGHQRNERARRLEWLQRAGRLVNRNTRNIYCCQLWPRVRGTTGATRATGPASSQSYDIFGNRGKSLSSSYDGAASGTVGRASSHAGRSRGTGPLSRGGTWTKRSGMRFQGGGRLNVGDGSLHNTEGGGGLFGGNLDEGLGVDLS
jgi:hypothetical protein